MKTILVLIIATASLAATVAFAGTPPARKRQKAQAAATLTEVKVCPITGTVVKGKGTGNAVVGKHRVYFCCTGCQEAFANLSQEEKEKKVADAVEKQKQMTKKG
ncbi:MAG: hypothetical protein H0T92_17110 [Pyrinomonadaceae bacterium]|nr:hypothetical protein [Pyrinomonadaceae bacterium]